VTSLQIFKIEHKENDADFVRPIGSRPVEEVPMFKRVTIGVVLFTVVIIAVGIVGLHYKEHKLYREEIAMTMSEIDYLETVLKKKNADDCIVEPAAYGWKCTDFKGRVYKVFRNEDKIRAARLRSTRGSNHEEMAQVEIH